MTHVGGGPSWLDWDRYDIVAKIPPGATRLKDRQLMLQDLLAERFKLVVHSGDVPQPAYMLTVAKDNPNLKPSTSAQEGSYKSQPSAKPEPGFVPPIIIGCRGVTMDSLANTLHEQGWGYVDSRWPVVDATGLKGTYDFSLKFTPWDLLGPAGSARISLYQALEQQLGLKLEIKTVPFPGLVVDSVNEEPTPNSPDLDKIMPPPQRFEVASIRPARPGEPTRQRVTQDELTYEDDSLKSLIVLAWDLGSDQAVVAPNWIADDHIDIQAKVTAGESINSDDIPLMLRSLLIDRFQIKYHMEDRPVDAYTLVAEHPKLTRPNPSERTRCRAMPGRDGKDLRMENAALDRLQTCTNMTMSQFAVQLQTFTEGLGVKDATGLKGAWDFAIAWSSFFENGAGSGTAQTSASGAAPEAPDPNGAISLFDALRQQLGLKLVKAKLPEPVLVIDQINQQPTEN
jgi:uncharacterized protein (TIGR03435 family)